MSKKRYVSYWILSFIVGLFILPSVLEWLGLSFSFANVLSFVFGAPNVANIVLVAILIGILLIFVGRCFYKDYKNLS